MPRSTPGSNPRYDAKLRAISGASGGNLLPDVSDLSGLITLESERPEWAFLGGEYLHMKRTIVLAGGAGFGTGMAWLNPTNSGVLGVLEFLSSIAALDIAITTEAGVLASYTQDATNFAPRDSRLQGNTQALQVWTRNGIAGPATAGYRLQIGHPFPTLVLLPGRAFTFFNITANTQLEIGIGWRESQLLATAS